VQDSAGAAQRRTVEPGSKAQCRTAPHSTVQDSAVQYSTVLCGQYTATQCCAVQCNTEGDGRTRLEAPSAAVTSSPRDCSLQHVVSQARAAPVLLCCLVGPWQSNFAMGLGASAASASSSTSGSPRSTELQRGPHQSSATPRLPRIPRPTASVHSHLQKVLHPPRPIFPLCLRLCALPPAEGKAASRCLLVRLHFFFFCKKALLTSCTGLLQLRGLLQT